MLHLHVNFPMNASKGNDLGGTKERKWKLQPISTKNIPYYNSFKYQRVAVLLVFILNMSLSIIYSSNM